MPRQRPVEPQRKVSVNLPYWMYNGLLEVKKKFGYLTMKNAVVTTIEAGLNALKIPYRKGEETSVFLPLLPLALSQLTRDLNNLASQIFWLQVFLLALAGLGAFALAYTAIYLHKFGLGPLIMRAEAPEERARAQRVLAGCIIGGACLVLARPVASWVTGISIGTDPTTGDKIFFKDKNGNGRYDAGTDEKLDLPSDLADMADKLLLLLMVIGAVVLVVGIMWGGIQIGRWVSAKRQK